MDKKIKKKTLTKKVEKKETAKAISHNLAISTKQSVEVCSFIRGINIEKARRLLNQVLDKKIAVPFKRYNKDMPHKRGKIASGRYPIKTISEILNVLNTAQANAENKGLDSKNLFIKNIKADKGAKNFHPGRKRRRLIKNTRIEVHVEEK